MLHIRMYGDPVLRRKATPITVFDDALAEFVDQMFTTMYEANGVGLAAPQVGVSKQVFVALEMERRSETNDEGEEEERYHVVAEHALINPVITERFGEQFGADGCLSIPGITYEDMRRDLGVTVTYQDVKGAHHELQASGYFAHILQHEYDHLHGKFYFDNLPMKEKQQFLREHAEALLELQQRATHDRKTLPNVPFTLR